MKGLTEAAGVGTKKLAENLVSDIGSLLLLRRDAYLKNMVDNKAISKQEAWDLRHSDFNEGSLFNQEVLDRVHDSSQKRESDTISKRLLENVMEKQAWRGAKQPFRGGPSGRGSFSGAGQRGGSASKSGRGRGFRGRGRGGKNVNPFKQDLKKNTTSTQSSAGKDK